MTQTPWEIHAGWWQQEFTGGVDPEYEEQILPLAAEFLAGAQRVLDVGAGEGQVARVAAAMEPCPDVVVGVEPVASHLELARERVSGPASRSEGRSGPVYAQGLAEALPIATGAVDAVVICLMLEHVEDHVPVLAEVGRVLAPGGRFVLFLNHPLLQTPGSGWIDDHILEEQYWRVGAYLGVDVVMEEVAPGVVLPFVHRPLSAYVNTMRDHGLVIERMEEPAPPPGFLERAPEYAAQATIPRLLALLARRLP
ncbi:MAG: class I SAM-dependent methyltransferase [Actinobacteria bacterium]|nr:class I SAM-dependent methyltransferase [Actinomycetota bacterium]